MSTSGRALGGARPIWSVPNQCLADGGVSLALVGGVLAVASGVALIVVRSRLHGD